MWHHVTTKIRSFLEHSCAILTHCSVSSNSFHGQITQKAVHQISDPENDILTFSKFLQKKNSRLEKRNFVGFLVETMTPKRPFEIN